MHEVVTGKQGGDPEEDLSLGSAEGVEDEVVAGAGEGVLSVGGQTVGDNALLLLTTWRPLVFVSCQFLHRPQFAFRAIEIENRFVESVGVVCWLNCDVPISNHQFLLRPFARRGSSHLESIVIVERGTHQRHPSYPGS